MFWVFAGLMGMSLSYVLLVFTGVVVRAVGNRRFIRRAKLYGYTTKRDLAPMGAFLFMGLIGIILASIVNIFVGSSALHMTVSVLGVLIFAGLTAYDTQDIKRIYYAGTQARLLRRSYLWGVAPVSRFYQSVYHATAIHGQPRIAHRHLKNTKPRRMRRGFCLLGGSCLQLRENAQAFTVEKAQQRIQYVRGATRACPCRARNTRPDCGAVPVFFQSHKTELRYCAGTRRSWHVRYRHLSHNRARCRRLHGARSAQ